jgi:hypothetical protein
MGMLVWVYLKSLDVSVSTRHDHNYNICNFSNLKYSQRIGSINLNKYKSLLLASHVSGASRVGAEIGSELIIGINLLLNLFITYFLYSLLIFQAVLNHFLP